MANTFITLEKNDLFSNFNKEDLLTLLCEIESYILTYRNKLNLPPDLSFGIEIEYERIRKKVVDNYINKKHPTWDSKIDASLKFGGEVTSPILFDEKENWQELKQVCQFLQKHHANTLDNAAGHIHIGTHLIGNDVKAWQTFLKLYTAYESIIFRFAYGDKINARKKIFNYAEPISDMLYIKLLEIESAKDFKDIVSLLPRKERRLAVNFENIDIFDPNEKIVKNTIEFRSPNATVDEIIWQNNVNTLTKMLLSCKKDLVDTDYVDYILRKEHLKFEQNKYLYQIINLKNALEFVDLIFDNNLDKVYFLKQYLKGFEEIIGDTKLVKAHKFTRG